MFFLLVGLTYAALTVQRKASEWLGDVLHTATTTHKTPHPSSLEHPHPRFLPRSTFYRTSLNAASHCLRTSLVVKFGGTSGLESRKCNGL